MKIIESIDELLNTSYSHISLDLWLTLIKSNPEFKKERNKLFKDFFQVNASIELVAEKVRYYDLNCNLINERIGKNFDTFEIYLLILISLGVDVSKINTKILDLFYKETEVIFFKYQPHFINPRTQSIFEKLTVSGKVLNILSNTGFIKGKTLRKFLEINGIQSFVDFQLYSDECGYSKPNPVIFELLKNHILETASRTNISIVHIGDNLKADCHGAINVGLDTLHFNPK